MKKYTFGILVKFGPGDHGTGYIDWEVTDEQDAIIQEAIDYALKRTSFIVNMKMEDVWILKHVWREWLMPEETDAEYVPPKQFLVMERG